MSAEETVRRWAGGHRCPDCTARSKLTRDADGIWRLLVHHDATCPTFRRIVRRRSA